MPDKSRKATQARYQRRKAARQRLKDRTPTAAQPVQSDGTTTAVKATAPEAQNQVTLRYSVGNELRKVSMLGGSLIVILIVLAIIFRLTID